MLRAALLLSLTLIATVLGAAPALGCARTVAGLDLQSVTVPQLQAAMARGVLSSEELVRASLARVAAYDTAGPKLNAVRVLHPQALEQARALDAERRAGKLRGPLHGIPVLLKDNVDTFDLPTTAGSISLEGAVPKRDATITARLRAAGAVILGKANLSEFAGWVDLSAPPGWSSLAGQVLNAYTFGDPSGSSAGSGVAASMAYGLTIGTETSGSILSPSSVSSVVGVKTTLGLVSRAGILPLAPSFDVPGPMVRSVTDAALMLGAIAGPDPADAATAGAQLPPGGDFTAGLKTDALKGARLAYSSSTREGLGEEARALFDAAIARVEALGATVRSVDALDAQVAGASEIGLIPNEFKASLNAYLAEEQPAAKVKTLSDVVAFAGANTDRYPHGFGLLTASDATPGQAAGYAAAEGVRAAARGDIDAALVEGNAEAILAPGNEHANIGAAAGYPTVMVPLGYMSDGQRPLGLGFLGQAYAEPRLLALAYAYEQAAKTRVAPEAVNQELIPGTCTFVPRPGGPDSAPMPATPRRLRALRTTVRVRRRVLSVSVRGAVARRVTVTVRRGSRVVARRTIPRGRVLRVRVRQRGVYAVSVLDAGPPQRTARVRRARVR